MHTIYLLTSPSQKQYIGQTKLSLSHRWLLHVYDSKRHTGKLQNAIKKHGYENFVMIPLITDISNQEDTNDFEVLMIRRFNTFYNGYNLTHGGKHKPHTKETRRKISEAMKGKKNALNTKRSDEFKKNLSQMRMGNKYGLGYKHSEKIKQKMRVSQQKRREIERQLS